LVRGVAFETIGARAAAAATTVAATGAIGASWDTLGCALAIGVAHAVGAGAALTTTAVVATLFASAVGHAQRFATAGRRAGRAKIALATFTAATVVATGAAVAVWRALRAIGVGAAGQPRANTVGNIVAFAANAKRPLWPCDAFVTNTAIGKAAQADSAGYTIAPVEALAVAFGQVATRAPVEGLPRIAVGKRAARRANGGAIEGLRIAIASPSEIAAAVCQITAIRRRVDRRRPIELDRSVDGALIVTTACGQPESGDNRDEKSQP